ncbi:hypothetical protein PR048_004887 [Dryococelus australis]|uniref:Uncharacterized protein n=1 Tax=Dryococelus australis TaxID=614101 RepID=A0ABQ9I6N8_9NEOP|nr:hypothetical protein PR048_004887 [Dryococelus australis]
MSELRKECATFIVLCDLLKWNKKEKKRRYWIKDLYRERRYEGGARLLNMLTLDEKHCILKFRISKGNVGLTLRFLATGDSYTTLQYLFKISKQSLSLIIPKVCKALTEALKVSIKLSNRFLFQMPATAEDCLKISEDIEKLLVLSMRIFNSCSEYINCKGFFCIVLFALVSASYTFLYVDIGCPKDGFQMEECSEIVSCIAELRITL